MDQSEIWQFTVISERIVGQTESHKAAQTLGAALRGVTAVAVYAPALFAGVAKPGEVITSSACRSSQRTE